MPFDRLDYPGFWFYKSRLNEFIETSYCFRDWSCFGCHMMSVYSIQSNHVDSFFLLLRSTRAIDFKVMQSAFKFQKDDSSKKMHVLAVPERINYRFPEDWTLVYALSSGKHRLPLYYTTDSWNHLLLKYSFLLLIVQTYISVCIYKVVLGYVAVFSYAKVLLCVFLFLFWNPHKITVCPCSIDSFLVPFSSSPFLKHITQRLQKHVEATSQSTIFILSTSDTELCTLVAFSDDCQWYDDDDDDDSIDDQ